jgi:DNA repair protein RadC
MLDHEFLELLLCRAIPRRDIGTISQALIKRFGSFAEAVSAPPEQIAEIEGAGKTVVAEFALIRAAALRLAKGRVVNRPLLDSWEQMLDYCRAAMAFATREEFRVLYLDKRNRIIADEVQQRGTVDHAPVYVREVVKRALDHYSSSIILVHNHPSGDPKPSKADIDMTRRITAAARTLDIQVHDHIIIGRDGHASLMALGMM